LLVSNPDSIARQSAWDAIRQQVIEEKLEKLGVERGSGTSMLQVHAPHARAASVRQCSWQVGTRHYLNGPCTDILAC